MNLQADASAYHALAGKCGVTFDGFQETPSGAKLPVFTHPDYGTFIMAPDESLQQALTRKQIQFAVNHEG